MKKLIALLLVTASTAAQAQINVDVGFGTPVYQPAYVVPAPVVVERPAYIEEHPRYYRAPHEDYDWTYWHNHEQAAHRDMDHEHEHGEPYRR